MIGGYKIIHVLPFIVLFIFLLYFHKKCTVQSYLLFILYMFPLMNLRITNDEYGGFTIFDIISFYGFVFCFGDFFSVPSNRKRSYYWLLFIYFFIAALIGSITSEFINDSLLALFKILPYFIYCRLLIKECAGNPGFYSKVIKSLKFVYVVALAFLLIQIFVGLNFTFYPKLASNTFMADTDVIRYPGFFLDSQLNGQYLAMGSFLFLYLDKGMQRRDIILNYSVFLLGVIAIILAGSRAAFGGFCLAFAAVLILAGKRYRKLAIAMVIGMFLYSVMAFQDGIFTRSKDISDDFLFRRSLWINAYQISLTHPYFGVGVGNYKSYVQRHIPDQYLTIDGEPVYFDHPENGYLKIIVEYGYVGFVIFLAFIISPMLKALRSFNNRRYDARVYFLIAPIIVWLIAFNTVYSLWDYRILIMFATFLILMITYPPAKISSYKPA